MDFNTKVDRISGLPDEILCHILSFIPTKYAVATSVLSTRWKYLWTSVPVLNFDVRLHEGFCSVINLNANPGSETTFLNFVNRVMLLNDISNIQKFRLIYKCHRSPAPICTWLHVAISDNILELELDFYFSLQKEYMKLPKKLFRSNTLRVLKLSRMPLSVPSLVCLPNLKILEIRSVVGLDDHYTQILLAGCRVLEKLVIEETAREKPRVIDISTSILRSFSFSYKFVIDAWVDYPYKFVINAPNLEYFHVKGHISDKFVVTSLATLTDAHLDLRYTTLISDYDNLCHQQVCDLFKGIANAKFLSLSNDMVQLLCAANDLNLPRFSNLTKLALGIGVDICWKRLATEFIKCSPNLDVLTLDNKQQGLTRDIDEIRKNPPQCMPEYLLANVKEILLQELYRNFLTVPETAEHLLQDVSSLKRLTIMCQCPFMLRNQIGRNY
ncbi:putative F-box protein At1g58310 isoform X1 [Amaranthus tricolor]|uniref:putative F-box protein At1g58310 isoform X1 n=1 Tax=Amaranthus tricolor TaxID=29722 RepID=UPI00258FC736|nr:putative F-box protein At1g58310 isoform X1 [Amaranthus tricolor]